MNLTVNGKKIHFADDQFLCKGGEGKIYVKNGIAYKIFHSPSLMIPEAKIKELQLLDSPLIVKPIDYIFDGKTLIGFTMKALNDTCVPLVKMFTNTFRDANGITNDHVTALVENIKYENYNIHNKHILIVDGNELNYMVDNDFVTPYFIDVNCWQTPSFPATAIMPSIKDYVSKEFSILTDWYSFAVISFQLFIGIHPFRGSAKGYKRSDLAKRVKDCVSVLNPKVSIPDAARDFSLIPSAYMDWYFKLFEKGVRLPPPALPGTAGIAQVKVTLIQSTDNFEIRMIKEYPEEVLFYTNFYGNSVTKTKTHVYINKTKYHATPDVETMYVMPEMVPILVKIEDNHIQLFSLDSDYEIKHVNIKCTEFMISNNRLYLKNKEKLIEMEFRALGKTIVPTPKNIWKVEKLSSEMFSNVISQSVLGDAFLTIPSDGRSTTIKTPELDDYRIIDAKYDNGVCVVIGHKDNKYDKLIFKIHEQKYTIRIIEDVDYLPINFVTLDNGICIMINEDDSIELFSNKLDKDEVKRIEDPDIHSTMKLTKDGVTAMFIKDKKVFSIKMK